MRALRLAHRGDWRVAPENTLAAMRAALANPACDGLEFDVRGSAEGTPILLHDATLERVQGRPGRPELLPLAELVAAGIPTLAEVLAAAGSGPFLDVELKGEPVAAVVPVLEAARGADLPRTVVSSFEPETLGWLAGLRPAWPRWLNTEDLEPATVAAARALGCRGLSVAWRAIDPPGIARAAAAGLDVAAWTVRRRPTAARLERLGVVAICVEGAALDDR
ncbi:MAG TPA: glycerophosphodiester phosphodiesterase [Candidatus Limnocylindrales bacterium]|nr:glycerophosphodiester phosphodiesterase [Candidatus Limnocylindrales bacterium]